MREIKTKKYKPEKIRKVNEFYDSTEISETQTQKNDIQSMSGNEISIDDNADVPSNLINKEMKTCELGDNSDSNAKDIKQIENNVKMPILKIQKIMNKIITLIQKK